MSNATSGDAQAMIDSVEIRYRPCDGAIQVPLRITVDSESKLDPNEIVSDQMIEVVETIDPIYEPMRNEDVATGGEDRKASSKQDLRIALDDARKELVTSANDNAPKMAVEAHVDSIHAAVVAALDAGRDKGFSSFQVTVVEEFD
ncbi:MAG: hypothetical protein WCK15_01525 [Pirellula sp.]